MFRSCLIWQNIKHVLRKEIKKGNPDALQLVDQLKNSN